MFLEDKTFFSIHTVLQIPIWNETKIEFPNSEKSKKLWQTENVSKILRQWRKFSYEFVYLGYKKKRFTYGKTWLDKATCNKEPCTWRERDASSQLRLRYRFRSVLRRGVGKNN